MGKHQARASVSTRVAERFARTAFVAMLNRQRWVIVSAGDRNRAAMGGSRAAHRTLTVMTLTRAVSGDVVRIDADALGVSA